MRILELLAQRPMTVSELVAALELAQGRVSSHLTCLRWCGYVRAEVDGRFNRYALIDDRILGHTTLDMVKRYVALAEFEIVRRLHAIASPADRLLIGPRVSVIRRQAVFERHREHAVDLRMTVEQLVTAAADPSFPAFQPMDP